MPHIELGPVRERKHPQALAFAFAGVVQAPELGPLLPGVPLVACRADREDPLLGARTLFVAPGTAERAVEAVDVERLLERLGLHHVGVNRRSVREWSIPIFSPSALMWTWRSSPRRFAVSSRNVIISRNFQVVSTCSSGNGSFPMKAFIARCSITELSLPME